VTHNRVVQVPRLAALPHRRQLFGWVFAALALTTATIVLVAVRDRLALPSVMLFYLLLVVATASIGGALPALTAAVAAFLLVNWFFTPPFHTWTVAEGDHLFALFVFLAVAGVVSLFVTVAAHRAAEAERARTEAESLALAAATADALARANELRTALLAAVSHDLRTPLASIKASVTSLRAGDVDWSRAEADVFLATIEEETDHLNELVGNLLDMSRLQTGALELSQRAVGLEEVVPAALASLGRRAPSVDVAVPETLPRVDADPGLLERALANLVANAAVWSPPGHPVRLEGAATTDEVELRVIDHGPGIPVVDRERVFLPFQRLGDRSRGGVGLGLAVSRGFIEAMHGELCVEDTPGGGLTMVVRLPRAA
jgi:two-component system sensor histidine kinase KdpD